MPHYRIFGVKEMPLLVKADSIKEAAKKFQHNYPDAKYIVIFQNIFGTITNAKKPTKSKI